VTWPLPACLHLSSDPLRDEEKKVPLMTTNNGDDARRRHELIAAQQALQTQKDRIGRELRALNEALEPEKFAPSALLPCVSADTLVWTSEGCRRIDSLRTGERVLSCDVISGRVAAREILTVFTGTTTRFYAVGLGDHVIHATGSHRFWVDGRAAWVAARDLAVGMRLWTLDGTAATIDRIAARDVVAAPTYNIAVTGAPTYVVGPGVLVHNQGPARYAFGPYMIYEGRNPAYPDRVYIGQTNDLSRRQREHRDDARDRLAAGPLPAATRAFHTFMAEVTLTATVMGLSEEQASYLEQRTIDLAGRRAINRRQQANRARMSLLERRIADDQRVREQGYCV